MHARRLVLVLLLAACGDSQTTTDGSMNGDDLARELADLAGVDLAGTVTPGCVPQAEVCNQKDDDCDGLVDEPTVGDTVGVCDCNGGADPTAIDLEVQATAQIGMQAEVQVTLHGASALLTCNPGVVLTTDDIAARPPTAPVLARYGGWLYGFVFATPGTHTITAKVGGVTAMKTVVVVANNQRVEPGVTPVTVPTADHLTPIPSHNEIVMDMALDGAVTIGTTIYFFANTPLGPKLFSFDQTNGARQLSNTNPTGPDRSWGNSLRALGGTLYFDAFNGEGCVKIYKYTPGDALVTTPFVQTNEHACTAVAAQVATWPDSDYGIGPTGSNQRNGDDAPFPSRFAPVAIGTRVYFAASTDELHGDVFEYDAAATPPLRKISAFTTPEGVQKVFLYGVDGTSGLQIAGTTGSYVFHHGDPDLTAPTGPVYPVTSAITHGVVVGSTTYFADTLLYAWTVGDVVVTQISNTSAGYDDPRDLTIVGGKVYFSSLDAANDRHIYLYDPATPAMVTTPIADPCGAGCTLASQPLGTIGTDFYFNARDTDQSLKYYTHGASGPATRAFSINTAPSDYIVTGAAVNGAVYYYGYKGFVGELLGFKYPNTASQRGSGRFGYGQRELYYVPAGASASAQVFDTVDTDDGDDLASGAKYPTALTPVNGSMYFVARSLDAPPANGDFAYHLYLHTPGQAGKATTPVDDGIRIGNGLGYTGNHLVIGDTVYFVADVANDVNTPKYKLFKHRPGDGRLQPADAISDIVPGGSDGISLLTNVGGILVFLGADASGYGKLYQYDGTTITAAKKKSDIVPGADDDLVWSNVDRLGGDSSVEGDTLLLTSGSGALAFAYKPSVGAVLTAADAVTITAGTGNRLVRYQGAYYLTAIGLGLIGDTVFTLATSGGGVHYITGPYPLGGTDPVSLYPLDPGTSPVAYLKACSLYGDLRSIIDGVYYFWAYYPGTDVCGIFATTPEHSDFPGYSMPFPQLGREQTAYGTNGATRVPKKDATGNIFMVGAITTPHLGALPINTVKLFHYKNGALTMLSPSKVGNDGTSLGTAAGGALFFPANDCGGQIDYDNGTSGPACMRLYRYVP